MTRLALALAVVAAWALARRVPTSRQRSLAIGLSVLLALDLVRLLRLPPDLDRAAFVGWYAVTAWVVCRALGTLPASRALDLAPIFLMLWIFPGGALSPFAVALAVQLLAAAVYLARRPVPGQVETVGLLLTASSLADVAGPWLCGAPGRDWPVGHWPAVATWVAVAGWELRCWISAARRRG